VRVLNQDRPFAGWQGFAVPAGVDLSCFHEGMR
jgi:hypothetical protein